MRIILSLNSASKQRRSCRLLSPIWKKLQSVIEIRWYCSTSSSMKRWNMNREKSLRNCFSNSKKEVENLTSPLQLLSTRFVTHLRTKRKINISKPSSVNFMRILSAIPLWKAQARINQHLLMKPSYSLRPSPSFNVFVDYDEQVRW